MEGCGMNIEELKNEWSKAMTHCQELELDRSKTTGDKDDAYAHLRQLTRECIKAEAAEARSKT
jgi:hypothetical protein